MEPLRVGLMGLGRGGQSLIEALLGNSRCRLVAVASLQPKRIERFAEEHPGIAVHNDFRSLIVSTALDALFVAVPPFLRGHYLPLAAERGLPVWMLTPAARRFDEAMAILERFEAAKCPIVVSRAWGLEPGIQEDALNLQQAGRLFLARGNVSVCLEESLDWRGDSQRAGGGVLLYQAYALIDALVQAMGTPSTVYANVAGVSRPGTQFPYDTDDTAALICQFSGGAIAGLSACWTVGPALWSLELNGTNQSIYIDHDSVRLRDRAGEHELARDSRPASPLVPQIEDFLSNLRGNPNNLRATLRQHLPTMAVIQAAYLSARTGQPERPAAIFDMHNVRFDGRAG